MVRNRLSDIFLDSNATLRDNAAHKDIVIFDVADVEMLLPVQIGDYTDFTAVKNMQPM